jgi:hypothetical protein
MQVFLASSLFVIAPKLPIIKHSILLEILRLESSSPISSLKVG